MSIRSHILFMFAATVAAWLGWLFVIFSIDPDQTNWIGFTAFYLTFFLAVFGTLSVSGFFLRSVMRKRLGSAHYQASVAMRQAFLWTAALVLALALQGDQLLNMWILITILVLFALIEFFITSLRTERHEPQH